MASRRGGDLATIRRVSEAEHGTSERWHSGSRCTQCRRAHSDTQWACGRARAQKRLPVELRQQLLDAIYAGQPFRTLLRALGLTSNQVWGLTGTDQEWSAALEAALTTAHRDDLDHGTNAAYVAGCLQRVPRASVDPDGEEPELSPRLGTQGCALNPARRQPNNEQTSLLSAVR
jgi:hypothetical protein